MEHEVFIWVNGEEKWSEATVAEVLDQATVKKYRISAHCSRTASETLDLLPLKRSVGQQI